MKKIIIALLVCLLVLPIVFCGCKEKTEPGTGTEDVAVTTAPEDTPEESPAAHEITVSELDSMLVSNGNKTNVNRWFSALSYHGGQQMRVCHTERGSYAAFAKDFGDADGVQKFYVVKVDGDGRASLLHYGEFPYDDAEITVNIGQDKSGDIIVTAASDSVHTVLVFDQGNDKVTEYSMNPDFKAENRLAYSQTMFDFENGMLYVFNVCGSGTTVDTVGDAIIEWYSFDLEAKEWSEDSVMIRIGDVGRHAYFSPMPDGKGGAYIVGSRNEYAVIATDRFSLASEKGNYLWDRLAIFCIPDLSDGENVEYVTVQEEDGSRGLEGIWSGVSASNYGDVFVDASGYIHIAYQYRLVDYAGTNGDLDDQLQYRHAIYSGKECIYNEKITLSDEKYLYYKPMIRQSTDGQLHMIAAKIHGNSIDLEFYRAEDELGKEWKYEKTHTIEGVSSPSLSLSAVRDGSTQDNVLSGFYYRTYYTEYGIPNGYTTPHTFEISLDDYSVTEPIYLLEGFDIMLDWRHDKRVPSSFGQTQTVTMENGIYAAFVYNYDQKNGTEQFYITKTDGEGNTTVLLSDSYESEQDKYLTMTAGADGIIYVCPPTGRTLYTVDTSTDEVAFHQLTPIVTKNLIPRQTSVIIDPVSGEKYTVSVLFDGTANISKNIIDSEKMTVALKNAVRYTNDRELIGRYNDVTVLGDGKGGAYLVGARTVTRSDLEGMLEYNGHIDSLSDSVMLFYIPGLSEGSEVQCIDVHLPYTDEGVQGIWSSVDVKDVYLDSNGKLNILYSDCHYDYDDADRRENPELISNTLKYYLAVYDGDKLVSKEELEISGLTEDSSVRIAETEDGTVYLVSANLQTSYYLVSLGIYPEGKDARIDVYCKAENGWVIAASRTFTGFAAEGFFISGSGNDVIDCLLYTSNEDVCHADITFSKKD
ncbi:MAG: hypothetical protein IKV54_07775 [Clostridia bacterium]|nr:hypothetical protein [Clostridia bacterium]